MTESNFDIVNFLRHAVAEGASDVHLRCGNPPAIRKTGKIYKTKLPSLMREDIISAIKTTAPSNMDDDFFNQFDIDYSFEIKEISRFRINVGHELGNPMMSIRMIPNKIPTFTELKLPQHLENFSKNNYGLCS